MYAKLFLSLWVLSASFACSSKTASDDPTETVEGLGGQEGEAMDLDADSDADADSEKGR